MKKLGFFVSFQISEERHIFKRIYESHFHTKFEIQIEFEEKQSEKKQVGSEAMTRNGDTRLMIAR